MKKPFYPAIVFYSDKDQGYIAKAEDLKDCSAFGEKPDQTLKELATPVELWISVAKNDHVEIPAPSPITEFG